MPITLVPPKPGRTPNYRVRGTYLGVRVDRSTETPEKAAAQTYFRNLKAAIERGSFSDKPELTMTTAAKSWIQHGGESRFLGPIIEYFGPAATLEISQAEADDAAHAIYPRAAPSTRQRQFYAPLGAILRHAGVTPAFKGPKDGKGRARNVFLHPAEFERLADAATACDPEFGVLMTFFAYTGARLSEALRVKVSDVDLSEQFAFCGKTKNGDPRPVHLPPRVVAALANHPRGLDRPGKLFRWAKGSELYLMAERAYAQAGVDHHGAPFHILRHTFGAWLTRAGGDLVGTGVWKSETAARVYKHFVVNEEARKADLLPGAGGVKRVEGVRNKLGD